MMNFRNNQGLTLMELIISIAVGSIVTLAATTMMLMGLRIYNSANQKAQRQNEIRVAITVMERMVAEAAELSTDDSEIICSGGEKILAHEQKAIITGSNVTILDGVDTFAANLEGNLLTITFTTEGDEDEPYVFSVYCPMALEAAESEDAPALYSWQESPEKILYNVIHDEALTPGVGAFLKVLESQVGSTGRIITEDGEGEYYSSWYIGGYEGNPGWSEETPWCVCFIAWALEECRGYFQNQNLRLANVDELWVEFITTDAWKTEDPQPGDVVFFDWIADEEKNPEHAGIFFAEIDGWIYTIEGNSDNTVKVCKYSSENPYILGYGTINWN